MRTCVRAHTVLCACLCVPTHACVCMGVWTGRCEHKCVCANVYVCLAVCFCARTSACVCACVCVFACVGVGVGVGVDVGAYMYVRAHVQGDTAHPFPSDMGRAQENVFVFAYMLCISLLLVQLAGLYA